MKTLSLPVEENTANVKPVIYLDILLIKVNKDGWHGSNPGFALKMHQKCHSTSSPLGGSDMVGQQIKARGTHSMKRNAA